MRIAIAQLNPTIGDFAKTQQSILEAIHEADEQGADLVVLPELATMGYPPRDLLRQRPFVEANVALVESLAKTTARGPALVIGFAEPNTGAGNPLYNSAAFCDGGRIVEIRRKSLLPTYDVFDEDRYFEPAADNRPIEWGECRIGLTICEDIWFGHRSLRGLYNHDPVGALAEAGIDLLINIAASPFTVSKSDVRRGLVGEQARRWSLPIILVNQVGAHDELIFDGHSLAFNPDGTVAACAADFATDLICVDVDGLENGPVRLSGPSRRVATEPVEEIYRALVTGLRDYARRCKFERVVLGLSGGIDSALTAALAAAALGPENVLGVAMPSRYSSDGSVTDAKALAQALEIRYEEIPIEPVFSAFLGATSQVFADLEEDVTEENIQARIRGTLLMALSNKHGSLLLTTGNKSELAVGYCTLYGDMCGGLAVISDVPKTMVYALARWINRDGVVIPESTLTKPPSAELRPDQEDQDTLPEYEVLDRIVEGYVEDGSSIDDLVAAGLDRETVTRWVGVINRNEYKRRQAAPGLRVTSKAFGMGRRMPIAACYCEWTEGRDAEDA